MQLLIYRKRLNETYGRKLLSKKVVYNNKENNNKIKIKLNTGCFSQNLKYFLSKYITRI